MKRLTSLLVTASCLFILPQKAFADPGEMMGGGNIYNVRLSEQVENYQTLNQLGVSLARMVLYPRRGYWSGPGRSPNPQVYDDLILAAYENGIQPMFLFAYRKVEKDGPLGGYQKWYDTGLAFAERYQPNSPWLLSQGIEDWGIEIYSAINEPAGTSIPVTGEKSYYNAIRGLADGVHASNPSLKVIPGGFPSRGDGFETYLKAIAPLFNQGKLDGLDLHKYSNWKQVTDGFWWSAQSSFEKAKQKAGIVANINYYCTEFNAKGDEMPKSDAARLFLTLAWDQLGVVDESGKGITQFAMPWSLLVSDSKRESWGIAPPEPRSQVLKLMLDLSQGMDFVSRDPKKTGVYILEGNGKKLWVWQNLRKWTNQPGTAFEVAGIPPSATQLKVYGWDGLRKAYSLSGETSLMVRDLSPQETYMFVAEP